MPLTPGDRLEILDLLGNYNFAIDFGLAEAWADTFTDNGVFESPLSAARGRDELVAFAQAGASANVRHWLNNVVIKGDGDEATTDVYLVLYQLGGEAGPVSLVAGRYNDTLARVNGAWKFRHRKVTFDAGSGALAPPVQ